MLFFLNWRENCSQNVATNRKKAALNTFYKYTFGKFQICHVYQYKACLGNNNNGSFLLSVQNDNDSTIANFHSPITTSLIVYIYAQRIIVLTKAGFSFLRYFAILSSHVINIISHTQNLSLAAPIFVYGVIGWLKRFIRVRVRSKKTGHLFT